MASERRGRMPHTSTARGKRVYIQLVTGEVFVARFKQRIGHHWIEFEDRDRVRVGSVVRFISSPKIIRALVG